MKALIWALVLLTLPVSTANAAIYAGYDGVSGSSDTTASTGTPDRAVTNSDDETSGGNVEFEWKVEEGESTQPNDGQDVTTGQGSSSGGTADLNIGIGEQAATGGVNVAAGDVNGDGMEGEGVEPDEIDFQGEQESNFAILLSSGGSDGDNEKGQRAAEVLEILKDGLEEEGVATEHISLNFEKITTKVKQEVKLFGFIPVQATATVEIDAEEKVKVKFPWWTFLAGGKNSESLGQKVFSALSNVLKTKHDTLKNSINNVR